MQSANGAETQTVRIAYRSNIVLCGFRTRVSMIEHVQLNALRAYPVGINVGAFVEYIGDGFRAAQDYEVRSE